MKDEKKTTLNINGTFNNSGFIATVNVKGLDEKKYEFVVDGTCNNERSLAISLPFPYNHNGNKIILRHDKDNSSTLELAFQQTTTPIITDCLDGLLAQYHRYHRDYHKKVEEFTSTYTKRMFDLDDSNGDVSIYHKYNKLPVGGSHNPFIDNTDGFVYQTLAPTIICAKRINNCHDELAISIVSSGSDNLRANAEVRSKLDDHFDYQISVTEKDGSENDVRITKVGVNLGFDVSIFNMTGQNSMYKIEHCHRDHTVSIIDISEFHDITTSLCDIPLERTVSLDLHKRIDNLIKNDKYINKFMNEVVADIHCDTLLSSTYIVNIDESSYLVENIRGNNTSYVSTIGTFVFDISSKEDRNVYVSMISDLNGLGHDYDVYSNFDDDGKPLYVDESHFNNGTRITHYENCGVELTAKIGPIESTDERDKKSNDRFVDIEVKTSVDLSNIVNCIDTMLDNHMREYVDAMIVEVYDNVCATMSCSPSDLYKNISSFEKVFESLLGWNDHCSYNTELDKNNVLDLPKLILDPGNVYSWADKLIGRKDTYYNELRKIDLVSFTMESLS